MAASRPRIEKQGTIDCDMVETTPVVFLGQLYRFEYVRNNYLGNSTGNSYFRFVEVESGRLTPAFATGFHLGSAHVQGNTMYVYGVETWGGSAVRVFWSKDLVHWSDQPALILPGWGLFNNSVCQGLDRFIMVFEVGEPPEVVGVRFTNFFAESQDLLNWRLLPTEHVFSKDRYTACPALRYLGDGYYYMIYLEARPGPTYESHIVRSRDLVHWQHGPLNPVLRYSAEDKHIANPVLTPGQRDRIAGAVNLNNSDVDLCEFAGEVILYYSWGNQQGIEHLAQAVYKGSLEEFLQGFFPEVPER